MAIDPCTEYGLALALEDFVPVILAGAGALALARTCGLRHPRVAIPAFAGAVLVTAGGLGKALWKTLVAAEPCRNVPLLEQLLFPCLAFGFAALAWAVVSLRRDAVASPVPYVAAPLIGSVAAVLTGSMGPLLGVAALGALWMGLNAATHARLLGRHGVAGLFVAYLIGTLILPPLAARPHQSEGLQWIEQGVNSVVQLCFLIGSSALLRHAQTRSSSVSPSTSAGALS
ncbi:hypothetical protein [Nocardioides sp.]|uniref:hypothetical protein n=1 Tax=Nocardioides sp. TaxID=35761 RepID=UPI0035653BB5